MEKVLCVRRDDIAEFFSPQLTGNPHHLRMVLDTVKTYFIPRSECETNPAYLQLIPYVMVKRYGHLLQYRRVKGSGETRLVGKASVGFGGHINETDLMDSTRTVSDLILAGARRELLEELGISALGGFVFSGFVYSNATEVDRVHLGVVLLYFTTDALPANPEHGEFVLDATIEEFETWSNLLLGGSAEGVWLR